MKDDRGFRREYLGIKGIQRFIGIFKNVGYFKKEIKVKKENKI